MRRCSPNSPGSSRRRPASRPACCGLLAALLLSGCQLAPRIPIHQPVELTGGGWYRDVVLTEGRSAAVGDTVSAHYEGKLESGDAFDSTYEVGQPIQVTIGDGTLPPGVDAGLIGMRPLSRRLVALPPEQAFGIRGVEGYVPPEAWVYFELELLSID